MSRITPQPAGTRLWFLLDLRSMGQDWYFTDAPDVLKVTDATGTTRLYLPALGQDTSVTLTAGDPGNVTASGATVSLSIQWPSDYAALAAVRDGTTAYGSLAKWAEGTSYEARRVLVRGVVTDPSHGWTTEPVSLTLEAAPWTDTTTIPPASATVDGANWTDRMFLTLFPEEQGLCYPRVYGTPGSVSLTTSSNHLCSASEGVWVQHANTTVTSGANERRLDLSLVIAGHHVTAGTVWMATDAYPQAQRFKVRNTKDYRGNPIAVVQSYYTVSSSTYEWDSSGSGYGDYTWNDGTSTSTTVHGLGDTPYAPAGTDESFRTWSALIAGSEQVRIYVVFRDEDDLTAGGMVGPDGSTMRGAGDVIADLLSVTNAASGLGVDRARFGGLRPQLNAYKLDFAITEQAKPWDIITSYILPILPISIETGPDGMYPVLWQPDATVAALTIDADTDVRIQRGSPIRWDRSQLANDFRLQYAKSRRTGDYAGSTRLVADSDDNTGTSAAKVGILDYYCRASQNRYRTPDGQRLVVSWTGSTDILYDDATVIRVLQSKARLFSFAVGRAEYDVPDYDYAWVELGHVAAVTDSTVSLGGRIAQVESLTFDTSPYIRVGLRMYQDPLRDMVIS